MTLDEHFSEDLYVRTSSDQTKLSSKSVRSISRRCEVIGNN